MIEFSVDARSVVGKLDGEVRAVLTSPSGISTEALVSRKSAGQYVVTYSVFEEGSFFFFFKLVSLVAGLTF
jgi:hypothetical protein